MATNPIFQKRHYELIAKAIRNTDWSKGNVGFVHEITGVFMRDNPRFDVDRFVKAAYAPKEPKEQS